MSATLPVDKKVMRIALVGIRPADQVILKGYLRVLLRLETDLEWVSANNPVVDLFMISQEFQNAESVQRILGQQNRQNVLYITRSPVDMGSLTGNLLTLPLKELEQLNQWLNSHISVLNNNLNNNNSALSSSTTTPEPSAPPQPSHSSRQTLDEIIAQRAKNPITPPPSSVSGVTPVSALNQNTTTGSATSNVLVDLVKVAEQLQKRQTGLQTLMQGDSIIAYIAPERQRIWVITPAVNLTKGLVLNPSTTTPPITQQQGEDAVQWLWEQAFNASPAFLAQLVRHDTAYGITSWLKPAHSAVQHDILKIQCVLEAKNATLDTIIQTAEVPRELAVRTVAGLMLAGVMPTSVYTALSSNLTAQMPPNVASLTTTIDSTILDSLPTHSVPPQPQPVPTAISQPTTPPPNQTPTPLPKNNDNMKGFLGRLRSKLGL